MSDVTNKMITFDNIIISYVFISIIFFYNNIAF